ncbi:MAG: hypothetical protein AAF849_18890 [Bacteroidota bacterium]
MTVTLNIEPDLKQQMSMEARQRGIELEQYIVDSLREYSTMIQTTEAALLKNINEGFSDSFWRTYHRLVKKRNSSSIKNEELDLLIEMTEQIEKSNVKRLESLSELAVLRETDLLSLMSQLGIKAPSYA